MQLARLIFNGRNGLYTVRLFFFFLFILLVNNIIAQNSPYSRYGLGDQISNTNIATRGMGGLSAGYRDPQTVNFNNPASYSAYLAILEGVSKDVAFGRVVFDAGVNIDSRTLRSPNTTQSFTSTNAQFSYLQLGLPIRKGWGIAFGLRPITRVGYSISRRERLRDPSTSLFIDSAVTEFTGDGGSFLPSIGTGFAIKNFSAGFNFGYLFGKKEIGVRRALINDSINYQNSVHSTLYSFGDIFFNAGLQYNVKLTPESMLTLGAAGNFKQNLKGRQDIKRESFVRGSVGEEFRVDSVLEQNNIKGEVIFPASFTYGFMINNNPKVDENRRGWSLGADLIQNKWDEFRFFGATDSVRNNWEFRLGGQLNQHSKAYVNSRYGQLISYRAGIFIGKDHVNLGKEVPLLGATFGIGLPIFSFNDPGRYRRTQATNLNLAFEYVRKGNNESRLKENMFRVSIGLNFSDSWFSKRKYD